MYNLTCAKFLKRLNPQQIHKKITMTSAIPVDFDGFISLDTPLEDYERLISENVESEDLIDDEIIIKNYKKIASVARQTIWKLLFETELKTTEQEVKVANFLNKVKQDACFHDPWSYNGWIADVRDELIKKKMLDFWRNQIVEKELGPCWARDSDYFDDMDDPEPEKFYRFAGCVAPFEKITGDRRNSKALELPCSTKENSSNVVSDIEPIISIESPVQDYEKLVKEKIESEHQIEDQQISENFKKIAITARDVIWKLLFTKEVATEEDKAKAGELLLKLKADACFYDPYSYNEWIGSVRDELLKREILDFWRTQIVAKELGPCWARDCDFFDDMKDPEPAEFYKHAGCVAPFDNQEKE